jgi:hypothetical protein
VTRIGIAPSGGGHRASVWGAGLLLYLADVGRHDDVGAIASVSGGSITNAVVAHEMDYRQASAAEVRAGLRPPLRHIAYTGLFFWGPSTNLYVVTVLAILGFGVLGLAAGLIMAFITSLGIAPGVVLAGSLIVLAAGVLVFAQRDPAARGGSSRKVSQNPGQGTGSGGAGPILSTSRGPRYTCHVPAVYLRR